MGTKVAEPITFRSLNHMNQQQNAAFHQLLSAWKKRDDLRQHGAHLGAMVEARRELDHARLDMWRANGA